MITGVKAYSIDRYTEKLLINPTDTHPKFKPFYHKCNIDKEPEKEFGETQEDFDKRILHDYTTEIGNFKLVRDIKFKKKHYKCSFSILYRTNRRFIFFGHLSWYHKNHNFDVNLLCLDIANYLFYQRDINIQEIRAELLSTFKLSHNNYQRFDICLDIEYDIIRNFERRYFNKKNFYFKSTNKIDKECLKILGLKRDEIIGEQIIFKSPSFDETFCFYNKKLEIESNKHKDYLKEYYMHMGFNINKPIYRIEIRMSRKSQRRNFVNINPDDFTNQYKLKRIMNEYIRYYLDFRKLSPNRKVNEYLKKHFI